MLQTRFGKNTDISPIAESRELSCHSDGESTIIGGEYDGRTLSSYIKENKGCLGKVFQKRVLKIYE